MRWTIRTPSRRRCSTRAVARVLFWGTELIVGRLSWDENRSCIYAQTRVSKRVAIRGLRRCRSGSGSGLHDDRGSVAVGVVGAAGFGFRPAITIDLFSSGPTNRPDRCLSQACPYVGGPRHAFVGLLLRRQSGPELSPRTSTQLHNQPYSAVPPPHSICSRWQAQFAMFEQTLGNVRIGISRAVGGIGNCKDANGLLEAFIHTCRMARGWPRLFEPHSSARHAYQPISR